MTSIDSTDPCPLDPAQHVPVPLACRLLGGVSARWLWSATAPRGPIPCVRLGRRVVYRVADLTAFAEAQRVEADRRQGGAR